MQLLPPGYFVLTGGTSFCVKTFDTGSPVTIRQIVNLCCINAR
jgi:hypothetical protein